MNRLEDADAISDVRRRCVGQAPHQAGCHIREDVSLEIGKDDHVEVGRVHHQLHRQRVHDDVVRLEVRVVARDVVEALEEEPVGELHDVRLVSAGDPLGSLLPCDLEGIAMDLLAAGARDEPTALRHVVSLHVLDGAVGVLDVLAHHGQVEIAPVMAGRNAGELSIHALVGEGPPELARGDVHALVAAPFGSLHRPLEEDPGGLHRLSGLGRDARGLAVRRDVLAHRNFDELERDARRPEDVDDDIHHFGTNAITLCQRDLHYLLLGLAAAREERLNRSVV